MSPPLISKEAARYTGAGGKEHCSLCRHFEASRGGRCRRVLGQISPRGWCKLFSQEVHGRIADAAGTAGGGGPALALNFLTPGTLDPRLTFSRASTATYFDSAGVMRNAATNYTTNSVVAGAVAGTPGTDPTGWSLATNLGAVGLTKQIVGAGTVNGMGYVDVRYFGTAIAGNFFPSTSGAGGATTAGIVWATSVSMALVAGSLANVVAVYMAANFNAGGAVALDVRPFLDSTLKRFAASAAAPAGTASIDVLFWNIQVFAGPVDFTLRIAAPQLERNTQASAFIPTTTTPMGAPRWDYDPSTLALRGLLLEDARTNALFPSVIGGANWSALGNVVLGGSITLPDGTASTTALISAQDTANAARQFYRAGTVITATAAYTVSAYFKASPNNVYIQANATGGTTIAGVAYFDLTAGTAVVGADLAAGMTAKSAAIAAVGGGWWRCSFTFTTVAGNTALQVAVGPCVTVSPTGDGRSYVGVVGQGIYAWGVQVEAGAFATSYIPTASAAVTRAQDVARILPANMAPWFNASAGSWQAEFVTFVSTAANARILGAPTAPGGGITPMYTNSALLVSQYDGAAAISAANAITANVVAKASSSWAAGTGRICANGGAVVSGAEATGFAALAASGVGLFTVSNPGLTDNSSGYIRAVRYYARVLADSEMQQITGAG